MQHSVLQRVTPTRRRLRFRLSWRRCAGIVYFAALVYLLGLWRGSWALAGTLCLVGLWKLWSRKLESKKCAFEAWFSRVATIGRQYDIYPTGDEEVVWRNRFRAGFTPEQAVELEKSWKIYRT